MRPQKKKDARRKRGFWPWVGKKLSSWEDKFKTITKEKKNPCRRQGGW